MFEGTEDIELKVSHATPRVIVERMVEDALLPIIERSIRRGILEEKNLLSSLRDIKVIDPACGSGRFLCAMINMFREWIRKIWMLTACRPESDDTGEAFIAGFSSYPTKEPDPVEDINESLFRVACESVFGVDRHPFAVEVAKTCMMLEIFSYVPDELSENVTRLLDTYLGLLNKSIRCGDSLFGVGSPVEVLLLPTENIRDFLVREWSEFSSRFVANVCMDEDDLYQCLRSLFTIAVQYQVDEQQDDPRKKLVRENDLYRLQAAICNSEGDLVRTRKEICGIAEEV